RDEVGTHHEAAHARWYVSRHHRQPEAADQQLAERVETIAPDHVPRRHLAGARRTGAEAVDEEADRDDGKTDRELAGDRQVAAALAEMRVGIREDRRQDHDPDRIERLVLAGRPGHAEQAEALVPLDVAK